MEEDEREKLGRKALSFLETYTVEQQHKIERDNLDSSLIGSTPHDRVDPVQFDDSRFWGVVDVLEEARQALSPEKFQELISLFQKSPADIMYRIEELVEEEKIIEGFRKICRESPTAIKTDSINR